MLPESNWNSPYIAIEEIRKEIQFQKFVHLSNLWESPASSELIASLSWNELFNFQSTTLKHAIQQSNSNSYFNQIESSCWQYGKSLSEKDWPSSSIRHPYDGFLALKTLRVGSVIHSEPFILERKTSSSCSFYWMNSPQEEHELCLLYHEIFRGYFYHLSRNLRVEITPSILPRAEEKIKVWKLNLLWID